MAHRPLALAASTILVAGCPDFGRPTDPDAASWTEAGALDMAPTEGEAAASGPDVVPTGVIRVAVMRNLRFLDEGGGALPAMQVRVGDTLRFRNDEGTYVRHNVQDGEVVGSTIPGSALFRSDYIDPGQWFDYVVTRPGRFFFFCPTHVATMRNQEVRVD